MIVFDNRDKIDLNNLQERLKLHFQNIRLLYVVKKNAELIGSFNYKGYHLYQRNSPIGILDGLKLADRLKKTKHTTFLFRKYDISIKIFVLFFLLIKKEIGFWKENNKHLRIESVNKYKLFITPFGNKYFYLQLLASILLGTILLLLMPLVLLSNKSLQEKKKITETLYHNFLKGPTADNPWLWIMLQQIMLFNVLFSNKKVENEPGNILVIRIDHIGDNINTIPLMRHLRKKYPEAEISILTDSGRFIWDNCPYIDNVIHYKTNNTLFTRDTWNIEWMFSPLKWFFKIRKQKFDLVLDPVGRTETHILSLFNRNCSRISNTYYPYALIGIDIAVKHYETRLHETKRALSLIMPKDGIHTGQCKLEFWHNQKTLLESRNIISGLGIEDRNILGVHPGAASKLRLWSITNYAQSASVIAQKRNMHIIFFEPPEHPQLSERFAIFLNNCSPQQSFSIIKDIDLDMLSALISRCHLFLCSDSGPMHLAAANNVPVIAVFGPGEYFRWKPQNKHSAVVRKDILCSPCSQNTCDKPHCLLDITPKDVIDAEENLDLPYKPILMKVGK